MKNSDVKDGDAMAPADLLEPVLDLMRTDGEAALSRLDFLIGHYENDPRLYFMRGSVLAGLEHYADARVAMQKAVEIAPDYGLARFQLGFLALTSGEVVVARSIWHPLLDLAAEHPLKLFVQGIDAMLVDNFQLAIGLLEAGIERNKELPPLSQNIAILIRGMREKLKSQDVNEDIESGAHFLLKQYSFKDTRH